MPAKSYVVVFPSVFARRHMTALTRNIRRVLKVQKESFTSVRRDGDVILVDAHDPVFASTAVGLLFGVDRTIIARRVENEYEHMVKAISEVGGNLLLAGDRFLVRVEGRSVGFLPQDVEMAATSRIIESKSQLGALPGTADNHDKLLYTYMSRNNAYVSIFADHCLGGVPLGVQGSALCCVFDAISAVACLEAMRTGFEVDVMLCYARESERMPLAKMLDRLIPRMVRESVRVTAVRVKPGGRGYLDRAALAAEILVEEAVQRDIKHVVLPVSRTLFAGDAADLLAARVFGAGLVPVMPLPGDDRLFRMLAELNVGAGPVRSVISKKSYTPDIPADTTTHDISRQDFEVKTGPNNLHDILDTPW